MLIEALSMFLLFVVATNLYFKIMMEILFSLKAGPAPSLDIMRDVSMAADAEGQQVAVLLGLLTVAFCSRTELYIPHGLPLTPTSLLSSGTLEDAVSFPRLKNDPKANQLSFFIWKEEVLLMFSDLYRKCGQGRFRMVRPNSAEKK